MSEVRIRSSDPPAGRRPAWMRHLLAGALYPVFGLMLGIPVLRRWRRGPHWKWIRLGAALLGVALLAGSPGLRAAGAALLVLAALLSPLPNPDRIRLIAESLGALHTLNGGCYHRGPWALPAGAPLQFFLSPQELWIVPLQRPDQVLARHPFAGLRSLRLDGEDYRPRNPSLTKEPPRREAHPDRQAVSCLELDLDGSRLEVRYQGMFARHLAEIAAYTLYAQKQSPPPFNILA